MVATLRSRQAVKLGARSRTRSASAAPAPAPAAVKKEKRRVPVQAAEAFAEARTGGKRTAKAAALKVYSPRKKALRATRNGGVGPKAATKASARRAPLAPKSVPAKKDAPARREKGEAASPSKANEGAATEGYEQYVNDMKSYFADVDAYDLQEA